MEQDTIQTIEHLFHEKAVLYADLLECLKKERAHLTAMEFEPLWSISDEKHRLCAEIESRRARLASETAPAQGGGGYDVNRVLRSIPLQEQGSIRRALHRIAKLKSEVEIMRRENKAFIDESLDFLDEMISLLAGEGNRRLTYNGRSRLHRPEALMTLSREV